MPLVKQTNIVTHLTSDADIISRVCFFFFFQAEDGIRDLTVTGVQTCALPISPLPLARTTRLLHRPALPRRRNPGGARQRQRRADRRRAAASGQSATQPGRAQHRPRRPARPVAARVQRTRPGRRGRERAIPMSATVSDVADWWATGICRMEPGIVELRGIPVQNLIGSTGLAATIWLLTRGTLPDPREAALLEAALVASVDHGPQAPSIAIAPMTLTCGVGLNNAIASGVNALGDVHGGAGEQCVELLNEIVERESDGLTVIDAAAAVVGKHRAKSHYIPGFGHRFHPVDPRRGPLLALVDQAVADRVVAGRHARAARAVETALNTGQTRSVPMNIDGATAVIYAELGFPPPLARGLFVLSRNVG